VRVSLAQAARQLGVSERTIRRRLAAGQLSGIQMQSDTGPRWLVEVADVEAPVEADPGTSGLSVQGVTDSGVAAILGEIRALRAEVAELRAELKQQEAPALLPGPETLPWWRRLLRWS
jgi:excisionase family DNA binding protein